MSLGTYVVQTFFSLQCPNTSVQECSSLLDLIENYSNWLDYGQAQTLENVAFMNYYLWMMLLSLQIDTTEMFKHFEQAATLFGLTMNTKKTDAQQPPPGRTSIDSHVEIYGTPLKSVKSFTYMGNIIASDNTIDVETNHNSMTNPPDLMERPHPRC